MRNTGRATWPALFYTVLALSILSHRAGAQQKKPSYLDARRTFETKLIRQTASPQKTTQEDSVETLPIGASQIFFKSTNNLTLRAWTDIPLIKDKEKYPAIVFLHGGLSFGKGDWDMTEPFRDAGFIVIAPMLRGEDGQSGNFTFLYDEVNDAIAAAAYAKQQPFIDKDRIYLAGHSVGGILALLTSMSSGDFKKAASFSGLPDMVSCYKYVIDPRQLPFDTTDRKEFEMRSPFTQASSFRCPVRMYFGTEEPWILGWLSERTALIAKQSNLDVEAESVTGGHMSAVEEEMRRAIRFFNQQ